MCGSLDALAQIAEQPRVLLGPETLIGVGLRRSFTHQDSPLLPQILGDRGDGRGQRRQ